MQEPPHPKKIPGGSAEKHEGGEARPEMIPDPAGNHHEVEAIPEVIPGPAGNHKGEEATKLPRHIASATYA